VQRYLVDVVQEGAEDAPALMAYPVESDTPELARLLALPKALARYQLDDPPAPASLRVRLFTQEGPRAQRWNDIEDPHRYKLLAPAPATVAAAHVCFHSEWNRGSALLSCEQCLEVSYPGIAGQGDSYHKPGCAQWGRGSSGCTLHIGPEIVASLLARGEAKGRDWPMYRAGGLTAGILRQLFPALSAGEQGAGERTKQHLAVVSALQETWGDKLRDMAQVVFPASSVQEGSIWRLRGGGYGALVDGIWLLLEDPGGDNTAQDPQTIERWVVQRDSDGYAMLAPRL
jgi:hypothetical protein